MKIKTSHKFTNLKGEVIYRDTEKKEALALGEALAEIVIAPRKDKKGFRPLKGLELARKLYNDKEVEIDKADLIQLKEAVEDNQSYVPLITAQILEVLEELKEDK